MKKIVTVLFIGLISFAVQGQAKMSFEEETIDYGVVKKGDDGVRVFKFTNTGNEALVIEDIKSTCGCTVPKKPEGPVAPGETSTIEVKYNTNKVGPIRKTITVYSNADEPIKALKIKGAVTE